MGKLGIAMDLGTSGFRGQALDLDRDGMILSTAVTPRHPLPGANVMDHLHSTIDVGLDWAQETIVCAVNRIIDSLGIRKNRIARLAVCGNPIQLSIFQGMEIRDLAYAGKRKLQSLGVVPPNRDANILKGTDIAHLNLPGHVDVMIPPAVRHEIGADALAMMIQTGMLERDEIAIATDYGTNAEMALIVRDTVYTGSTAAGPALEGQQIENGILALPGAISDVHLEPEAPGRLPGPLKYRMRTYVLDNDMNPALGDIIDPVSGTVLEKGRIRAVGITGTGVVSLLREGLRHRLIELPKINTPDETLRLPDGIRFTRKDLLEAGKAIGSIRAGHITLCREAEIDLHDIETAYMSGASGTYVDALKAQEIGLIPAGVERIYQVGNTSLAMARDMIVDMDRLWEMQRIADDLRQHHCMFAESKVFEKVYILELSYWTEGMPMALYQAFLQKYGLSKLKSVAPAAKVIKTVVKDIQDPGVMGIKIISDIGRRKRMVFNGCVGDAACAARCPENALRIEPQGDDYVLSVDLSLCNGVACRRCEEACNEQVLDLVRLLNAENDTKTTEAKSS